MAVVNLRTMANGKSSKLGQLYVIRREGGRDRRVVHVDRLRRFDAVAETDVALAGQLTGPRRLSGGSARVSANSLSVTSEVIE